MSSLVSGPVHFAQIPDELWNPPPWINETKATERMEQMEAEGIAKSGRLGCDFRLLPNPMSDARLGITICADSSLEFDLPTS